MASGSFCRIPTCATTPPCTLPCKATGVKPFVYVGLTTPPNPAVQALASCQCHGEDGEGTVPSMFGKWVSRTVRYASDDWAWTTGALIEVVGDAESIVKFECEADDGLVCFFPGWVDIAVGLTSGAYVGGPYSCTGQPGLSSTLRDNYEASTKAVIATSIDAELIDAVKIATLPYSNGWIHQANSLEGWRKMRADVGVDGFHWNGSELAVCDVACMDEVDEFVAGEGKCVPRTIGPFNPTTLAPRFTPAPVPFFPNQPSPLPPPGQAPFSFPSQASLSSPSIFVAATTAVIAFLAIGW